MSQGEYFISSRIPPGNYWQFHFHSACIVTLCYQTEVRTHTHTRAVTTSALQRDEVFLLSSKVVSTQRRAVRRSAAWLDPTSGGFCAPFCSPFSPVLDPVEDIEKVRWLINIYLCTYYYYLNCVHCSSELLCAAQGEVFATEVMRKVELKFVATYSHYDMSWIHFILVWALLVVSFFV